ncbi:hypothetical protein ACFVHB_12555 [Kitasatospora sp. NPDC127111]|uniref:hypothetical protein n=1 Tax=Kitasatospora sp. NPDC127111 TaxID=3345363 RepID=UPI003626D266
MLRRLSTAAVAATIAAGALLAVAPAQSASAGTVTCDVNAMRNRAHQLRSQGYDRQANILDAQAQACEDAENNMHRWG